MYPERVLKTLQRAQADLNMGDAGAAIRELEKIVRKFPKGFECWLLYGQAKGRLGDHAGAESCFRKAAAIQPKNVDGWYNLGISLETRKLHAQAASAYRKALACLDTPHPAVCRNLASCYIELGDYAQAVPVCEALASAANNSDAWALLGIACQGAVRYEQARDAYLHALGRGGQNNYTIHLNLGSCYSVLNDFGNAALQARRALELKPDDQVALHNLGSALFNAGHVEEAIDVFGKCALPGASASLLLALNYLDPPNPERLLAEHEAAMAKAAAGIAARALQRSKSPDEKLRIGFVSPDFREHPVAHFIEGMLSQIDRDRFELFYYSDVRQTDTDAVTARFQALGDRWHETAELDDAALDALVRSHDIHVLVDLAGHTHTRLHAFARRMAPVQATYLGYSATTGLAAMDYLLADDVLVQEPADEAHYSEQVVRLGPVLATYTPPADNVSVPPLPMLANAHPTFGSFAPLRKISPSTVRLWAAALHAVPAARMLVMGKGLHTEAMQQRFLEPFLQQGLDASRFILRGSAPMEEYLRTYAEVDLILDTVPWNGHTTTLHALWMGVPTLSVSGGHHAARFGEMVLKAAGLDRFLARDPQDFAQRAQAITADAASLSTLRATLRERLLASPLCDHRSMARRFEEACLAMWSAQ